MATATDLGDVVALQLESLAQSEASMRCSIIWAGDTYPVTGGPEYGGKKMENGGNRILARTVVKLRVEVLPDGIGIPKEDQTLQYFRNASAEPRTYRIEAVTNCFGAWLELHLEDPHRAA